MRIGLVRRGYSPSGGAERYLKRFGEALAKRDHEAVLFSSPRWPRAGWPYGPVVPVHGESPQTFAAALERLGPDRHCDFLYSLERVHACDAYRAGDGVHRAWLARRKLLEPGWRVAMRSLVNHKHREILALEKQLLAERRAGHIVVNSEMVRREIAATYGYPDERIHTVYNGVPIRSFQRMPDARKRVRERFLLAERDLLVLFAGSGWERTSKASLRPGSQAVMGSTKGPVENSQWRTAPTPSPTRRARIG